MQVVIVGGGLAGLAAAAALSSTPLEVHLLEARPFLGGRATSYALPNGEIIDNSQHILLRCCVNLQDFYQRLGVARRIRFYRQFYFLEPGGRQSQLQAAPLPAPLHLLPSFLRLRFLTLRDKLAVACALATLAREYRRRADLDSLTMGEWLREKRQTPAAIERFWRPVLVSAVNEEPEAMSALSGCQVFYLGFLSGRRHYEMGVPAVPLAELYASPAWAAMSNVKLHLRTPVKSLEMEDGRIATVHTGRGCFHPDWVICSLPVHRTASLLPQLNLRPEAWGASPITGIHLWFDRPVTRLPHAALLDSPLHWFFTQHGGRYLQLVVSASRHLLSLSKGEIVALALKELAAYLPAVGDAALLKAHVVKELHATFSARPGLEPLRPAPSTSITNLFLAGDWTRTGWPATMEGAVRSGYAAAEALCRRAGIPARFLLSDVT